MNTDGIERTASKAVLAPIVDEIIRMRLDAKAVAKHERRIMRGWK